MTKLLPQARVLHYSQQVPQEPNEHPEFWSIWRNICKDAHPERIDFVFGSEPYVLRLATELGARPVLVDPERLAFPISATAIRQDPISNWEMIPGIVRSHYQRRVVLTGAESTGKSTLAKALAQHFSTRYVPEYGRTFDACRVGDWNRCCFEEIESRHQAMRQAVSPYAGPLLIEDTDELVTRVWEKSLTGNDPMRQRPHNLADLYLLLATDLPWHDDGTRYQENPSERAAFQAAIEQELRDAGVNWQRVHGTGPNRLLNAITAIESTLGRLPIASTAISAAANEEQQKQKT